MKPFKAYDIRGFYPEEVNPIFAYDLGLAFASYMKKHKYGQRIVVGKDIRIGSKELQEKFMLGCLAGGLDVSAIIICTTPALLYMTKFFDAGVMVTASHNPKEYNGFKFSLSNGKTLSYDKGLDEVEKLMPKVKPKNKSHKFDIVSINPYLEKLKRDFKDVKFKRLNIIADSSNGATASTYTKIFNYLGLKYKPICLKMDGTFPNHDPNPLKPGALDILKEEIISNNADIGLAFDGDGDRLVIVDDKGKDLSPAVTGKIISKYYLQNNAKFVLDIILSKSLGEFIYSNGGEVILSKVGQVNIKQRMIETNAVLGIEASGHVTHGHLMNIDDGLYSALIILEILSHENKKLSEIHKELTKYFGLSENLKVKNKQRALSKIREKYKDARMQFVDGITLEYADWWANIRPSNTEDLIRVNLEANTEKMAKAKMKEIYQFIKSIS